MGVAALRHRLRGWKSVALDTSVFAYQLLDHPHYAPLTELILHSVETGHLRGVTTTITLAEILTQAEQEAVRAFGAGVAGGRVRGLLPGADRPARGVQQSGRMVGGGRAASRALEANAQRPRAVRTPTMRVIGRGEVKGKNLGSSGSFDQALRTRRTPISGTRSLCPPTYGPRQVRPRRPQEAPRRHHRWGSDRGGTVSAGPSGSHHSPRCRRVDRQRSLAPLGFLWDRGSRRALSGVEQSKPRS